MKRKLLYFTICCAVFLVSCSAQEDFGSFTSSPVNSGKPNADTIANPYLEDSTTTPPIVPEEPTIIIPKNNIVAHRGAWNKNNFPQNSIASLKEAIRLNCKGSEFDIQLTADDSLVINHDQNYNGFAVEQSKYSDLITLKLSNGEKLPTLREYIVAGKRNNSTTLLFGELKIYTLNADRKKTFILKTLELVNKLNAQKLVVYSSFHYDVLKQISSLNPVAELQYLGGNASPEQLKMDKILYAVYSYDVYLKNPQWINSAKSNNVKLGVWTVDSPININWSLTNNFDAIITNQPELALSY